MVYRLLSYELDFSGDETDEVVDSKSPGSGKQWDVQEVYVGSEDDVSYSIVYEERKLADNVPDTALPDEDNGLPFDLTVAESEDLVIQGTETDSSASAATFVVVVDETVA